jgi:hypothetical protein
MALYTFRFKEKQIVQQQFIEASSLESAERLGRGYCGETGSRRYISVADAVLIREGGPVVPPAIEDDDNDLGLPMVSLQDFDEHNKIKLDAKGIPHKLGRN